MDTSHQIDEQLLASSAATQSARTLDRISRHVISRAPFRRLLTISEMAIDFWTISVAMVLSYSLYSLGHLGKHIHYSGHVVLQTAFGFAAVSVWFLERNGAYRPDNSLLLIKETERVLRSCSQVFLAGFCISLVANYLISRWVVLMALVFVPLSLIIEKRLVAIAVSFLHTRGYGRRRVVIYGTGEIGRRIFSVLLRSPKLGLEPVAFFSDSCAGTTIFEASYSRRRSASVSCGLPTMQALQSLGAQLVVIADPSISRDKFVTIASEATAAGAAISFVPGHYIPSNLSFDYVNLDGILLAFSESSPAQGAYGFLKRALDLVTAPCLLVLLSPLLAVIAVLIRWSSEGPVFFTHERIGLNGRRFKMYKFRTMYINASPYAFCPTEQGDPRITKVGQFLRRTSFDELPQLFNVLMGEMSLVGPRPEMPFIVEQYNSLERRRLTVKPGITGLWQLSADRRGLIHENLEYDLYYIRNRNFFMDVAILFHTAIFAMRGI